jgi:hypothetical protein
VQNRSRQNRTTEKCSKIEKVIHIKRIIKQFSGRTGLTIPVVDASTEPEEIESVLAQNRKGRKTIKSPLHAWILMPLT